MRLLLYGFLFGIISTVIHALIQLGLVKYFEWPALEAVRFIFIIATMVVVLFMSDFVLKRITRNNKVSIYQEFFVLFFIQLMTIISLHYIVVFQLLLANDTDIVPDAVAIASDFNYVDLLFKILIFAIILPLAIISIRVVGGRILNYKKQI